MRWVALVLLFANLGLLGHLVLVAPGQRGLHDPRGSELNADRITHVRPSVAPPKLEAGACLEWGPLAAAELARAQERIAEVQGAKAIVREARGIPVWWVHVPAVRSRDEAERRLREIEELGVKEARVVADDGYRNAISLGIFRSEEAASTFQARMREIKVRNSAIVQRSDLLKFSTIVIAEPSVAIAARLVELSNLFAGSEVKAVACAAPGG